MRFTQMSTFTPQTEAPKQPNRSFVYHRQRLRFIQTEPLFSSFLSSHLLQQVAHTAKLQFTSSQYLVHPRTSIYVPPFRYFEAINLISGKI